MRARTSASAPRTHTRFTHGIAADASGEGAVPGRRRGNPKLIRRGVIEDRTRLER